MEIRWKKLLILLVLYIVQGIPYGFQSRFLPIYMRAEGSSLTSLGFMKMLYLPWVIKTLWAPFVDAYGSKLLWLQSSITALLITCLILAHISFENYCILIICLFMMNLAASIQDIAVDAFAITTLNKSDLGVGNVAQVVGYKTGAIIGGGVLISLSQIFSWSIMFLFLVIVYTLALIMVTLSPMFQEVKIHNNGQIPGIKMAAYWRLIKPILSVRGTKSLAIFLLTYKLCEVGSMNMIPLYMIDKGHPITLVGFWTGIVGQFVSISGSASAAWLLKYHSTTQSSLCFYCILRIPFMVVLVLLIYIDGISSVTLQSSYFLVMNILLFLSGIITTTTFTLMMESSQSAKKCFQATHFTTLSTIEVVGKLLFSIVFGAVGDTIGYLKSFQLCLIFALFTVFLLHVFKRELITDSNS